MGIIYCYHCIASGKKYIGQTMHRWERYRYTYHKNFYKTTNITTNKFINALQHHGWNSFIYGVIEECDDSMLNDREIYYIDAYDTFNNGYNTTLGGLGRRGHKHSEETKKLMSLSHMGKHTMTEEHKQIIRQCNTGRKLTPEQRDKHRSKIAQLDLGKTYIIIKTDGDVEVIKSLSNYCKQHNINQHTMRGRVVTTHRLINGQTQRIRAHKPINDVLYVIKTNH